MNLISQSNFESAVAEHGFRNVFPNSKLELLDSANQDGESYVKFLCTPVNGEEAPFKTRLSTGVIATDPEYKQYFELVDGQGYQPKEGLMCAGIKNKGLKFSLA